MSQIALETKQQRGVLASRQAPGSAILALMAGVWGAFVALLAVSPSTLEDGYAWLRGLPFVWELLVWLLTLPWTVAYLVYETSWEHWLRVVLVAVIVVAHVSICAPRLPRPSSSV